MNPINYIIKIIKKFSNFNPNSNKKILNLYFKSIFYRKKHLKKGKYEWLKEIELKILNKRDGLLKYKNFKFILPKNDLKYIPLHQKYLYAALISYYNIPKYYLLFWDDLIIFYEFFIKKIYDKVFNINQGDVVFDVGASIGWYAFKISQKVGENGTIIAIEPDPENFSYLKRNLELNKYRNIIPLNLGIWSSKRKMTLIRKKYASTLRNILIKDENIEKKNQIQIDVDTIDNIMLNLELEKVDLIKMDIEGAEIEAIKGAKKTLTKLKDIRLIIAAYHETVSGIKTYRFLVPYLERLKFRVIKENLPYIYAEKHE